MKAPVRELRYRIAGALIRVAIKVRPGPRGAVVHIDVDTTALREALAQFEQTGRAGKPILDMDDLYHPQDAALFNELGVVLPGTGKTIPRAEPSSLATSVQRSGMPLFDVPPVPRGGIKYPWPPPGQVESPQEVEYDIGSDLWITEYPDKTFTARLGWGVSVHALQDFLDEPRFIKSDHSYDNVTRTYSVRPHPPIGPEDPTRPHIDCTICKRKAEQ